MNPEDLGRSHLKVVALYDKEPHPLTYESFEARGWLGVQEHLFRNT
jgi:hypothetical protein